MQRRFSSVPGQAQHNELALVHVHSSRVQMRLPQSTGQNLSGSELLT